jgi:acyl-coenzyme A synthetase/AMP-(fatty) acid ligase
VGLYSPSTLDYLINIYALGRLGYTSFLISPRLPAIAVASLLEKTEAHLFLHAEEHESRATQCREFVSYPLKILSILSRSEFDNPGNVIPVPARDVDPVKEQHRFYIMLHSSGSTGLPKPISYTNARLLVSCLTSPSLVAFQSLPFFHAHGLVTYSQAIWSRKTIYLFDGYTPQTNRTLTEAINTARPEIVWTVPYVLKLLAESEDGIETLKRCQIVSSSGSRCPDELGDMLTEKGIFLGCIFGSYAFLSNVNPEADGISGLRSPNFLSPYPVPATTKLGIISGHYHT